MDDCMNSFGMDGCPGVIRFTVTRVPQLNNSNNEVSRGKNFTGHSGAGADLKNDG